MSGQRSAARGRMPASTTSLETRWSWRVPVAASRLLLVANANASGLAGRRELVDGASWLLRRLGARVETRLTTSIDELSALVHEDGGGRLVLLGGDGALPAPADPGGPPAPGAP